jgi:pyroglutamyl-peptidase
MVTGSAPAQPPARAPVRPAARPAVATRARTVLLTGFEPFDGGQINPSWLVAHALHGRRIGGHKLVAARLPTAFGESLRQLDKLLQVNRPALVICIGQAGGRSALSLERVAINLDDARIPDNLGAQPVDQPVVIEGPPAYFSTLPIKAMLQAMQRADIAAEVSQTAGTFVCNHVFYGLMHALATQQALKHTRGGFVHVPYVTGQGSPSMPMDAMVHGLGVAVATALATQGDIVLAAGAVS